MSGKQIKLSGADDQIVAKEKKKNNKELGTSENFITWFFFTARIVGSGSVYFNMNLIFLNQILTNLNIIYIGNSWNWTLQ